METFLGEYPLLFTLLALLAIEQVAYLFPGTYPYRFGLPLRTEELHRAEAIKSLGEGTPVRGIKLKISRHRDEAYLRPSYSALGWGPIFFSCQIITAGTGKAITRMGPASAILLNYLLIASVARNGNWGFLDGLCILALEAWSFMSFRRRCLVFFEQVHNAGPV